jgi:hypothetical protein
MSYSQNTEKARACKRMLVKAFREARGLLEDQKQRTPYINNLWEQRLDLFNRYTRIPAGYWCVFNVIAAYCWSRELHGEYLMEGSEPDVSVAMHWCTYACEELYLDMSLIKKYPHHYPDHRRAQPANVYPNAWLGLFHDWFQRIYIPYIWLVYLKTHQRQLPGPKNLKVLLAPGREGA